MNLHFNTGIVDWISFRPKKEGELIISDQIEVDEQEGIIGDYYSKKGKRQVTLIQKEHLDFVSGLLNRKVTPVLTRRNIMVSGINLLLLLDKTFRIGDEVILRGMGGCPPCRKMEENIGEGAFAAMNGLGGIITSVEKGGMIRVGDEIRLI